MGKKDDFFIVGIGASAGGLDAIQKLFSSLPDNSGMAFVIVQHLSPDFKSLMPELLAKYTKMPIHTSADKQIIKPNNIYLNQRNKNLHIKGNKLYLLDKGPKQNLNLPIDIFFHTLGEEVKEKSIGIILSGTGSDGSRGIKTIKEAGGTIIVQDTKSAQFDGMPNSAISTHLVDFILSPEQIAETLVRIPSLSQKISVLDNTTENQEISNEEIYQELLRFIYTKFGIDYRKYRRNTLLRRIEKRMTLLNLSSLAEYYNYLTSNEDEQKLINLDFLIGVTSFFRDKSAFEVIEKRVIPEILKNKSKSDTIRVWIAGCSTGEEAYSIAMLFDDYIRKNNLHIDFKIFATDVDIRSLSHASKGVYKANIINEVPPKYVQNYFTKSADNLQIISRLRDKILFSQNNVLKDPPFIKLDLAICRNMLIYFNNNAQQEVLENMHFGLNENGILFLGSSESLGDLQKYFNNFDTNWKIYQKNGPHKLNYRVRSSEINIQPRNNLSSTVFEPIVSRNRINTNESYLRALVDNFTPSCIIADLDSNILYIHGDAGKKLNFSSGVFQNNLLSLISDNNAALLRKGIRQHKSTKETVKVSNIKVRLNEVDFEYDVKISSAKIDNDRVLLFTFSEDREVSEKVKNINYDSEDSLVEIRIEELEDELRTKKLELQNIVEELETSNEELQSSNEELMASNEELQSTNEELQSVNEELYTVNTELQEKNTELVELHDDINNLLNSTEIGTLFLDTDLKIRKFTKNLTEHFNLKSEDVGRPISSFASNFSNNIQQSIIAESNIVLDQQITIENEVQDHQGNFYLKRISPFLTSENKVGGVVLTFIGINALKKATKDVLRIKDELNRAQKISKVGSWYWDINDDAMTWTDQLYRIFNVSPSLPALHFQDQEELFSEQSWKHYHDAIKKVKKTGTSFSIELKVVGAGNSNTSGESRWVLALGEAVYNEKDILIALRGTFQDINEHKQLVDNLKYQEEFTRKITETSPNGIYIFNFRTGINEFMNSQYEKILGYSMKEINEKSQEQFLDLFHPKDLQTVMNHMEDIQNGVEHSKVEYRFKHKEGHWVWCYSIDSPFEKDEEGNVISMIGVFIDNSDQKQIEQELIYAKQHAEAANIEKNNFLSNMSHEIRTPINGIIGFADLLKDQDLTTKEREQYIEIIDSNSVQLLSLIDDILDISKLEAQELKINLVNLDLHKLLKELNLSYSKRLDKLNKTKVNIELDVPSSKRLKRMRTDVLRLRQVLSNLLDNAIKFTEQGTITFGYELKDDFVEFFVKDEGVGIPKEKMGNIFSRFGQAHVNEIEKYGGTGLGLAICDGIVDLLGGSIDVKSEQNKGSHFFFTLPLLEDGKEIDDDAPDVKEIDFELFKNKKIIVVDDEPNILSYYEKVLCKVNIDCVFATNGKDAVEKFKMHPDTDLILMDIRMPIMNGYEAVKHILKIDDSVKIIAQTAYAMSNEEWIVLNVGCVDYIAKPIIKDELYQKLYYWFTYD